MSINITDYLKKLEIEIAEQNGALTEQVAQPQMVVPQTESQTEPQTIVPRETGQCDFVHLHNHTDYSTLDGMCRIDDLVRRAAALGMPAVATDHGNISCAIKFYNSCRATEVKPIVGCEVYTVPDMSQKDGKPYHLVLLVKNETGYQNLVRITSAGFLQGLHNKKPRVDLDLISQHADGLICMTACIAGYVPSLILAGRMEDARAELGRMKDIFADDLYAEVMDCGMVEQEHVNRELVKMADEMGIAVVASNDCHYQYLRKVHALVHNEPFHIHTEEVRECAKAKIMIPLN